MTYKITRRDFLKQLLLLSLLPALGNSNSRSADSNSSPEKPNVLILLLDTLSARHLSFMGYPRETTPNLARFAEQATVYHRHYAAGNFTTPGTASLLTGMYPWSHRALQLDGRVARELEHRNLFRLFGDAYFKIAYAHNRLTHLLLQGFRQHIDVYLPPEEFGLVSGTFPSQLLSNDAEISFRSFDHLLFRDWRQSGSLFISLADRLKRLAQERIVQGELAELYPRGVPTLSEHRWLFLVEQVIDGVMASIRRMPSPFLAYYHLFFPHEPYRPHRDFVGMFDDGWKPVTKQPHTLSSGDSQEVLNQYRVEYDEYLASVDAEFGRLYDFLEETGIADNTHIILTSDHGQLFERGVHGHVSELLYEPIIHVPLLIAKPGQQQRRDVHTPTSCVDLLPTLLGTVGYAIPDWCEGKVLPVSGAETGDEERSVFSLEAKLNATHRPLSKATVALIRGPYKLIHYFGYDGYNDEYELYDLDNDPEELDDLYSTKRSIAADLRHDLLKKLEEENSSMSKREAMGEGWQRLATLSNIYSEGGCRHG